MVAFLLGAQSASDERGGLEPRLRCAVRFDGDLFFAPTGGDHVDALGVMRDHVGADRKGVPTRMFVTNEGRVLSRRQAQAYALKHDLLEPRLLKWSRNMDELVSEYLKPEALA